jgi:hypothetical protein
LPRQNISLPIRVRHIGNHSDDTSEAKIVKKHDRLGGSGVFSAGHFNPKSKPFSLIDFVQSWLDFAEIC